MSDIQMMCVILIPCIGYNFYTFWHSYKMYLTVLNRQEMINSLNKQIGYLNEIIKSQYNLLMVMEKKLAELTNPEETR